MVTPKLPPVPAPAPILRLAMLHLAAVPGDLAYNRQLVETATSLVVRDGKRLLSFESPNSAIWMLEWDPHTQNVTSRPPTVHVL